jgi:hypothetical protein
VSKIKSLGTKARHRSGKFTDLDESLLPLFSEPREGSGRDWRLLCGIEPASTPDRNTAAAGDRRRPPTEKR